MTTPVTVYPTMREMFKADHDINFWQLEQDLELSRHTINELRDVERFHKRPYRNLIRIVRNLASRNIIHPYNQLNPTNEVINVDGRPFAIPRVWAEQYGPKEVKWSKRDRLMQDRANSVKGYLASLNPNRYITDFIQTNDEPAKLHLDRGDRKYNKQVRATGPLNWATHIKKSNMDFIVLHSKRFSEEDDTLYQVTGWWKRDLLEGQDNFPVNAWLAEDKSGIRTITKHKHTAISGLNIRTSNQVLKTLAA